MVKVGDIVYFETNGKVFKDEVLEVSETQIVCYWGYTEKVIFKIETGVGFYPRNKEVVFKWSTKEAYDKQEAAKDLEQTHYSLVVKAFGIRKHSRTAKGEQAKLWKKFYKKYPKFDDAVKAYVPEMDKYKAITLG